MRNWVRAFGWDAVIVAALVGLWWPGALAYAAFLAGGVRGLRVGLRRGFERGERESDARWSALVIG